MTIHDEVILGAAQLRRQIKLSGSLKMDEVGCTHNAVVGQYTHPMGTVCPVCRGVGVRIHKNWTQLDCPKCNSRGAIYND